MIGPPTEAACSLLSSPDAVPKPDVPWTKVILVPTLQLRTRNTCKKSLTPSSLIQDTSSHGPAWHLYLIKSNSLVTVMDWTVFPQNTYMNVEALTPSTVECDWLGNRALIRQGHKERALIQHDRCPYKKKHWVGGVHRQRALWGHSEKIVHLQAKERSLRGDQTCQHLDLGRSAYKTMRNTFLFSKALSVWYFVMAALACSYSAAEEFHSLFLTNFPAPCMPCGPVLSFVFPLKHSIPPLCPRPSPRFPSQALYVQVLLIILVFAQITHNKTDFLWLPNGLV